ncbi:MAG: flagellar hook basal-body protein, partial [Nitrospirota bacterium]|nr:flagellar hook basal-body protein [Nitrospirota bacterium]
GNPLDVAINGEGFFALEGNRYTRNGSFKVDGEGYLVTANDIRVLGSGGPVSLTGSSVEITSSGEITVDNSPVDKLQIVDFPDRSVLSKMDGSVFTAEEQGETVDSEVSQGYLESSNVDAVREMVEMLTSQREFEAYQKIIRLFDDASSRTINEMGK